MATKKTAPTSGALPSSFKPTMTTPPPAVGGNVQGPKAVAAAPAATAVSEVPAVQSTYNSMIAQGADKNAALSSARYAGQAVQAGAMSPTAEFTATGTTVPGTNNVTPKGDTPPSPPAGGTVDESALARLVGTLTGWGLGSLSGTIRTLLSQGDAEDTVLSKIKYDPQYNSAYLARFAGNEARRKAGLNVLNEGTYLATEDSYAQTLKAYGLGNMLSTDAAANQAKFATWIGNDMSTNEFKDRIALVSDRVINMDPAIKANFQSWYPSVTNQDLVSYFLAPDETLPILQNKVNAAEIGAAANQQGLSTDRATAEMYAKQGETYAQAQKDYASIAEVLPASQKLSNIYAEDGTQYNQQMAEQEFIGQNAQAKLKRNRLASRERAMFSGDAGVSAQANSLERSVQGRF